MAAQWAFFLILKHTRFFFKFLEEIITSTPFPFFFHSIFGFKLQFIKFFLVASRSQTNKNLGFKTPLLCCKLFTEYARRIPRTRRAAKQETESSGMCNINWKYSWLRPTCKSVLHSSAMLLSEDWYKVTYVSQQLIVPNLRGSSLTFRRLTSTIVDVPHR